MLVGLYGHYGQYGLYGRYGSYGSIGLYGVYGAYGRRRGAQLTNFLFVRICILVFEHHVRRVFSWSHVSFSRFFSRSLLESAPCRGASHSSLCSQLRRSLCSQLRSSQCRALRSGVFVVQKKKKEKKNIAAVCSLNYCRQLPEITIFCTNFSKFARKWCKSSSIFDEQIHQFIKIW